MTTPRRTRSALTERLRAIAGLSARRRRRTHDDDAPRTRVHSAQFEHSHRVWVPDPPRRWYEKQGTESMAPYLTKQPRRWFW